MYHFLCYNGCNFRIEGDPMQFIKREKYLQLIRRQYDIDLIKVITGVRRAGKSVLLSQIKDEIRDRGVKEDHIIEINFEDLSFEKIRSSVKLNDYIQKQIKDSDRYYLFLDEIQHVRQYEVVLASLRATKNVSIFVTGSNSKLLSGRLASKLVGRCVEFRILPFSYSEMLEFYRTNHLTLPEDPLADYLVYGGMPLRFSYSEKEDILDYLKGIYTGIIDKDICVPNSRINKEKFNIVANYVLGNVGKRFSASNVSEYFEKSNASDLPRSMIYRYIEKLEQACILTRVNRYDVSGKRMMKAVEKHYCVDPGFRTVSVPGVTAALSENLENVVYNELIARGYTVYIGKTYRGEIDFIAVKGQQKCFIQVCYLLSSPEVIEREFGAFSSVKDASPKYVMSLDRFDMSRNGITHLNLEKWLKGEIQLSLS
ncbi:MAG: ATP-binding protein [Lachnospiraceae bacterium]|nr:ATP-binding protein [Lachnospiraceae bacterium]